LHPLDPLDVPAEHELERAGAAELRMAIGGLDPAQRLRRVAEQILERVVDAVEEAKQLVCVVGDRAVILVAPVIEISGGRTRQRSGLLILNARRKFPNDLSAHLYRLSGTSVPQKRAWYVLAGGE
jgi:hypothetical protein